MKRTIASLSVAATAFLSCSQATAAVVVYTDRAAWTAAVGALTTENFNSFADGTPVNSATVFPSGISTPTGLSLDISAFAFSSIGQGNALRTLGPLTIALPGAPTAFGFDYADVDFLTASTITFGAFSPVLPQTGDADTGITPDDFAFFGVVASAGDIPGGRFSIVTSEGLTIDNVSFGTAAAVPEGGTLPLLSLGLVAAGMARRMRRS